MPDINDPAQRLADLIDQLDGRIANVFRTAIASLKDDVDLNELADLIAQGRVNEALDKLQHAAEALGAATNVAFVTSGQSTAQFLTAAGVGRVVFDQVNYRAVEAMQANTLSLIREFTAEQVRATQAALVSGVTAGINPRAQARNFRDSIGLTENQWGDVDRYRTVLESVGTNDQSAEADLTRALSDGRNDRTVLAAARAGRKLPQAKIDQTIERYIARKIKYRAEVIGRTEALRAVHQGNEEMYRQAIEAGDLNAAQLTRKWVTRIDGRERLTHEILNDQVRGYGEPWTTIHGTIKFPGDPEAAAAETCNCRCALATRIMQNR